jgi:putative ABC transport system permease protein
MANLYKIINYFRISLLSLLTNRLRSFLSIIGVVFGVMAVIIIISMGEGAKAEALRQIEKLGTKNIYVKSVQLSEDKKQDLPKNYHSGLGENDLIRIQNGCRHIADITALKEIPASVIGAFKEITPQIISCTPSYFGILNLQLDSGRFISKNDINGHHQVCLIGYNAAARLGKDGFVGSRLRIGNHLFKIIGILNRYHMESSKSGAVSERNYNEIIILPLGSEKWLISNQRHEAGVDNFDDLSEVIIQIDTTAHVIESSRTIKKIMEINHKDIDDYQIVTPLELLQQSKKTNELFNLLLFGIASVSLLVGGIGIMNIMLATVSERRREIGIRRAVGAKQKHILLQFLTEASLLTFTGGLIGIIAGLITVFILKQVAPWELIITAKAIILPLIISSLTGVFFGSYPAYQAARLDPIQALRG